MKYEQLDRYILASMTDIQAINLQWAQRTIDIHHSVLGGGGTYSASLPFPEGLLPIRLVAARLRVLRGRGVVSRSKVPMFTPDSEYTRQSPRPVWWLVNRRRGS